MDSSPAQEFGAQQPSRLATRIALTTRQEGDAFSLLTDCAVRCGRREIALGAACKRPRSVTPAVAVPRAAAFWLAPLMGTAGSIGIEKKAMEKLQCEDLMDL